MTDEHAHGEQIEDAIADEQAIEAVKRKAAKIEGYWCRVCSYPLVHGHCYRCGDEQTETITDRSAL